MKESKHRIGRGRIVSALLGLVITAIVVAVPAAAGGSDEATRHSTSGFWNATGAPGAAPAGAKAYVRPDRFEAFTLDRGDLADALERTPSESARGSDAGLVLSLPDPNGGFQRFALEDSPIMEPALAAKHPDISTYRGRGLDDPRATIRADLTPLGFHASVRSPQGTWYIDPYYHLDDSLYVSYFARDLTENPHGVFVERKDDSGGDEDLEALLESAEAGPATGPQLRTYRLALVTDPTYATFFGGSANVTAAKVTLINRVTQIYEDETSIRLVLIGNNDLLNLDTEAQMTRGNGPCGEFPCYTPALATSCGGATLTRTRIVIGQIIGATNYDVGHIGLGNPGGGVASLGVVGGNSKAQGCTGLSAPVGDFFAVDYVAHEIGHQFAGNHTFNGTQVNCSGGNRNAANSVEPGSGSSIMAYAGICRQDDIQPHSDPYWSQRSFEEVTTLVTGDRPPINEVQTASLNDFSGGANEVQTVTLSSYGGTDSFQLQYNGSNSVPIVRGTNYNAAGIKAAIEAIPGFPAGGTVTVTQIGNPANPPTDTGFDVIFGGTLTNVDVPFPLTVVNGVGATGTTTETFNGGPTDDSFTINYNGTNSVPIVHGAGFTIAAIQAAIQGASEVQTVTLAGYDADGDSFRLSYLGNTTVPIVRGQNNTVAGIQNAIQGGNEQQAVTLVGFNGATQSFQVQIGGQNSAVLGAGGLAISNANVAAAINAIPGFPGTVTSAGAGNTGFTLTFTAATGTTDVPSVAIVNCTAPCTSSVRETAKGGGPMANWPSGGTVTVGSLSDTGFTLTFSGTHQGTNVAPFSVTSGTGGTTGTVAETVPGTAGIIPVGSTATAAGFAGGGLNDAGFQITFGGNLGLINLSMLSLTNQNGVTGFFGETAKGGPIDNKGFTITPTGNSAPVVTAPAAFTIPTRTPFSLTGSATDADGNALTYMWEQNDRGGATGTALINPNKVDGPLFRQFGRPLDSSVYNPAAYNSPGENHPTAADRTRVFPDLLQILADNTNAKTGNCPGPAIPPSPPSGPTNVPQAQIECYSEFLPTSAWVGFTADRTMHFRLTARDGEGGVGSQPTDTAVTIAPAAGPFLVTSQAAPATFDGLSTQTITWDVAGTDVAPVSAANVRITLSTDGGLTYPHVLTASTPNDGSQAVTIANVGTTQGRIRVEGVGNIFFDLNDADLTIRGVVELSNAQDATVEYSDGFFPAKTITATDPDTPGSSLNATATGLPAGLTLEVASTSSGATLPGTRTWRIAGTAAGPPGVHTVTVTVTDDQGHTTTQSFTITVAPADARATYNGDTLEYTRGSAASVRLSANVVDGATVAGSSDTQPGDIRKATVTFVEGGRTLCGPMPVESSNTANTAGSASCSASLGAGEHRIRVVVGDHYTATTTASVRVRRAASCSLTVTPGRLIAGREARVRAIVRLFGERYAGAQVRFQAPGLDRTVRVNGSGIASLLVRPSRAGSLRATVRANEATLGCRDTSRITAGSGTAGASAGGLTGRPRG